LALQKATQALELLLQTEQPVAWSLEPERLRFLKSKALALKARAELFLGLVEEQKTTLRLAKSIGLAYRVRVALNAMSLVALTQDVPSGTKKCGTALPKTGDIDETAEHAGWVELEQISQQEVAEVRQDPWQTTEAFNQDLWGKDVIHLMMTAKSQYVANDFAGALEQYIRAKDWFRGHGDAPPSPNILVNMANCYSKFLDWPLALSSAKQARELLLHTMRPKSWEQEPERFNYLKTKTLALQARAEEILGLVEDKRATLQQAKQLGLLARVHAQLKEAAQAAAARADILGLTSVNLAELKARRNQRKRSKAKAKKAAATLHMKPS
jgi:hypothetical protein